MISNLSSCSFYSACRHLPQKRNRGTIFLLYQLCNYRLFSDYSLAGCGAGRVIAGGGLRDTQGERKRKREECVDFGSREKGEERA